jgi:hypothetical protein
MADDLANSSADDSEETAHRRPKDQLGTEDLPIAPAPPDDSGQPIVPPGGPDPLDPSAPKLPPDQLDEAGFSIAPGARVVGPGRPKHKPKKAASSRSGHHPGTRVFTGESGVARFAEHLQESVADDAAGSAGDMVGQPEGQTAGAGSASGDLPVVTEPPDPPSVTDLPPAWTPLPLPPQPKPSRAKKPPRAPKPLRGSIEGARRLRPAPLAVPQSPPQPEDVGDFSDDDDSDGVGQSEGDATNSTAGWSSESGGAAGVSAAPGGRARGSFASSASGISSAGDPMRDARDLIVAFREAIEKLSQAADKLAQGGRNDIDRLDV